MQTKGILADWSLLFPDLHLVLLAGTVMFLKFK